VFLELALPKYLLKYQRRAPRRVTLGEMRWLGSDPLEQSSLAIGDIDSVQEIRNASLGHINTKSDLDDIHDGSD
jgi:hypothetical protein